MNNFKLRVCNVNGGLEREEFFNTHAEAMSRYNELDKSLTTVWARIGKKYIWLRYLNE